MSASDDDPAAPPAPTHVLTEHGRRMRNIPAAPAPTGERDELLRRIDALLPTKSPGVMWSVGGLLLQDIRTFLAALPPDTSDVLREMQHPPRPDCDAEGWHLCTPVVAPAPAAPTSQYRPDGWPLCPRCEADELADLVNIKADPAAELKCYVCQWVGTVPAAPAPTPEHDLHVMPLGDLTAHEATRQCWCGPKPIHDAPHGFVVVHNSADGRELVERGGVQ